MMFKADMSELGISAFCYIYNGTKTPGISSGGLGAPPYVVIKRMLKNYRKKVRI